MALSHTAHHPPRAGLYDALYALSTFLTANVLWVICALPLLTLPAATAALFAVLAPWARGESADSPLMSFGGAMRRYALPSSVVALLDLLLGGFCLLNLLILRQMGVGQALAVGSLALTVVGFALLIVFNVYVWPLMVLRELPVRALLRAAFRLTLTRPLWGALTALLAILPLVLGLFLPQAFLLTAAASASVLVTHWGAWRVLRHDREPSRPLGVQSIIL